MNICNTSTNIFTDCITCSIRFSLNNRHIYTLVENDRERETAITGAAAEWNDG